MSLHYRRSLERPQLNQRILLLFLPNCLNSHSLRRPCKGLGFTLVAVEEEAAGAAATSTTHRRTTTRDRAHLSQAKKQKKCISCPVIFGASIYDVRTEGGGGYLQKQT